MAGREKHGAGMLLSRLPLMDENGCHLAVIEAAAGSRNKCKFEPEYGALVLHTVLPLGTSFPYAFGFIPSTLADDGDPIDVLVLLDEPVPPGTVVPARIVGILEAEQTKGGQTVRNDRVLAVAEKSECYGEVRKLKDVAKHVLKRIERFFVFYHGEQGVQFQPLGWHGKDAAETAVDKAHKTFRRKDE
jgi:inorganic pyrophosphatase